MFDTARRKKLAVGLVLLAALLFLFLWFNRIPKLGVIEEDLAGVTGPAAKCFQGFCLDQGPGTTLFSRWWDFSQAYLELVALGMIFAFLIAGLTEVFLIPPEGVQQLWSSRGLRGSLGGVLVGPAMNLCSACIVPVANAFRRKGAGTETTLAIVHGSSTLNIPALMMAALVFTPVLAGARFGLSLVAVLFLGPVVAALAGTSKQLPEDPAPVVSPPDLTQSTWLTVLFVGLKDWVKASAGYLLRLGPIMVLAGFASAMAIQWVNPETVSEYLGDNPRGVAIAATLGLLINVPLLFEIPLVAALLLVGMGTAPAATLLFAAAAGGPITFWGLAKVMPKRAILTLATATWFLGLIAGLSILALGTLFESDGTGLRTSVTAAGQLAVGSQAVTDNIEVSRIEPDVAGTDGGVLVTVHGAGFVDGASITIDGIEAAWAYSDQTRMTALAPEHDLGPVDVVVSNPDGTNSRLAGGLTYQTPVFTDVAVQAGAAFTHYRDILDIIPLGAGVIVFDHNGDGLQDIYVTSTPDLAGLAPDTEGQNALFKNNGDGTFTDVAEQAGVSDRSGKGNGGCAADYDNDGDQDLFVADWGSSKLFQNNGDGTFTDVTELSGLDDPDSTYRSMGCAWGDYDRDGSLDFVLVRHIDESNPDAFTKRLYHFDVRPLALFHNNRDGTFTNVTGLLGATQFPGRSQGEFGNVWGAGFQPGWVDFDNDGDSDLYVVNDFGEYIQPNVLWRNDGPGPDGIWKFVDISEESDADPAMFGMGLAVGDYNTDGFLDLFITNMGDNVLLTSNADGQSFSDTATAAGVAMGTFRRQQRVSWGTVFFDYDNDGYEDLYVASGWLDTDDINRREQPNLLFRNNQGDGTFTDVSSISGAADWGIGRGVAYADFNGDGCLDLYLTNLGRSAARGEQSQLFQNSCDWGNNWLIVKTVGSSSNRDGIGARIELLAGGSTQIREVAAGASNKSQNMLPVHFGLGKSASVESIRVRWPSGVLQTLSDIAPNQVLVITEP